MQAVCAVKASNEELRRFDPINCLIYNLLPKADEYRIKMDQYSSGMFTHTIFFRKKYFSNLLNANAKNYSQLVVICGGLDFSCLSSPGWKDKPKFFIDHPLSLELSLPLLKQVDVNAETMKFLGIDLVDPDAAALLSAELLNKGFDLDKSTLVIWEGATYYIEKHNVFSTIEALSNLMPHMKLAFDFVLAIPAFKTNVADEEIKGLKKNLDYVKRHNEPWKSKFCSNEIIRKLEDLGFTNVIFHTDKDIINMLKIKLRNYKMMFGFVAANR